MREIPISNCEKEFVQKCLKSKTRIDGRDAFSYRPITLSFGLDYGCCVVDLGLSKVMAQVVAELDQPKESRQSEGRLSLFVEMSTMGSPQFDPAKPGDLGNELQRMLERSLVVSRAVDLEELCIRVGELAWHVRLHVHILSHDGNILDCALISAVAALGHFRRPVVTISGKTDVKIHSMEEKHPLPLNINHKPFLVTFAIFESGDLLLLDPSELEEKCMDGKIMICMNKHREVCCLQMSGRIQISKDQVLRCTNIAAARVKELSVLVDSALSNDLKVKQEGKKSSTFSTSKKTFKEKPQENEIKFETQVSLPQGTDVSSMDVEAKEKEAVKVGYLITRHAQDTVSVGEGKVNSWLKDSGVDYEPEIKQSKLETLKNEKEVNYDDENSEEEETVILQQNEVGLFGNKK